MIETVGRGSAPVGWADILAPVLGQRVQLALHHLPPHGVQPDLPGAGSCLYLKGQRCPIHELHPDRLLSFHSEGTLHSDPWRLIRFDGTMLPIPVQGMPGHYGRVGAASLVDVEKMRDQLAQLSPEALASVGVTATDMEAILGRLRKVVTE